MNIKDLVNRAFNEDGTCKLYKDWHIDCVLCPFVNVDKVHCDLHILRRDLNKENTEVFKV